MEVRRHFDRLTEIKWFFQNAFNCMHASASALCFFLHTRFGFGLMRLSSLLVMCGYVFAMIELLLACAITFAIIVISCRFICSSPMYTIIDWSNSFCVYLIDTTHIYRERVALNVETANETTKNDNTKSILNCDKFPLMSPKIYLLHE